MTHPVPTPKPLPKFIPTLTEVVAAPSRLVDVPLDEPHNPMPAAVAADRALLAQLHAQPTQPVIDSNELVQRVIQRLDGPLQSEMQSVLTELVQNHFRKLEPLVQAELTRVLRRRVEDALVEEIRSVSR